MQPYPNPYLFQQPAYQMPQYQSYQPSVNVAQINGRLIDNIDSVTANEVSMQGINVFPKNDLSEVFIKSWQPNGTIQTLKFVKSADLSNFKLIDGKNIDEDKNDAGNGDLAVQNGILDRLTAIENELKQISAISRPKKGGKNESTNDD